MGRKQTTTNDCSKQTCSSPQLREMGADTGAPAAANRQPAAAPLLRRRRSFPSQVTSEEAPAPSQSMRRPPTQMRRQRPAAAPSPIIPQHCAFTEAAQAPHHTRG